MTRGPRSPASCASACSMIRRESPRLLPNAIAKRRCAALLLFVVEVFLFLDDTFGRLDLVVRNVVIGCRSEIVLGLGDDLGHVVAPLALGLRRLGGVRPLDVLLIRTALRADGCGPAEVVELRAAAVAFVFGTQFGHAFSSSLGRVT